MSNKDIVIGIDFGTTNSAACIYQDGKYEIIPSAMGYDYFPSVVAVNENGELLVGHYAKRQMASNASNSKSEFKLKMGKAEKILFNGEYRRPQELTALVLGHIKKQAEAYLGQDINKAVISVPASFKTEAKNATMEAGKIAGFEVKGLVDEPTAACLAYSATKNISGNILVFDMGGGTLDITIGSFNGSVLKSITTTGAEVGGRNITIALLDYVKGEFEKKNGLKLEDYITPDYDPIVDLKNAVEDAKIELSSVKTTNIHIDSILMTNEGKRVNLDVDINRSKLNELSDYVVKRSKEKVEEALSDAKFTKDDIDYLVFVGGPTKMPLIRETIEKVLNKQASEGINPMLCVAEGASIYSGGPITVRNINSLTLSIVVDEKNSDPLIPKNTPLPAEATRDYYTMFDNQTSADIQIVEGESIFAKENRSLHNITLTGLPMRPKGEVTIRVKLKVDTNGIMELSAEEPHTKTKLSATIHSSTRMSREEIMNAGFENDNLLENYKEKTKQKDIINDAEEVIFNARKLIENSSDYMLMSDRDRINEDIKKIEGLLDNHNFDLIKLNTKKLQKFIEEIESDELFY